MLGRQKVAVEDVPVPVPGDGEVLVKMEASALCGSELNRYREDDPPRGNGGHEGVGVVADANRSERCKEGDRVGIYGPFGCGLPDCRYCSRGMDSLCPHHVHTGELHADFAVVNEKTLMPIPDDVPTHAAVLISGDGLGVPYHLSRRLMPGPDDRVVVFGCGPIGLGNVQLQHHYGAEVIAVDLVPKRLELARELGAAHTVDSSSTDPIEAVADLTNGEKAEIVIVATGAAAAFDAAARCIGPMARMGLVGGLREVTMYPTRDFWNDATILTSFYYFKSEFPEMVALYRAGFAVEKLITHSFPLEQSQQAFDLFAAGETGKVILER